MMNSFVKISPFYKIDYITMSLKNEITWIVGSNSERVSFGPPIKE